MNKHIKKLIQQATIIEEHGWGASYENFDREKFAELIVQECVNELVKWKHEPFPYDPEFGAQLIKQHFGVTE
jgi:hypothetical protein